MTKVVELAFIPSPGLSNLVATVEAAKLLLDRSSNRLTATILIIKPPKESNLGDNQKNKMLSIMKETPRLRFIDLPDDHNVPAHSITLNFDYIDGHIDKIRQNLSDLIEQPSVPDSCLAGLVLDMFCTKFIKVAEEFNIPSYIFFTSGACALGLARYLISLKFEQNQDMKQYKNSDTELSIPCLAQPLPAKVIPQFYLNDGPLANLNLDRLRRFGETKGILINTLYELEPFAIESLSSSHNSPKVYPVGPILEVNRDSGDQSVKDLMKWLDSQPENSVVFLCFGTMAPLTEIQVKEFAKALEESGSRFVWSLRMPKMSPSPSEYGNFEQILPVGFLESRGENGSDTGG